MLTSVLSKNMLVGGGFLNLRIYFGTRTAAVNVAKTVSKGGKQSFKAAVVTAVNNIKAKSRKIDFDSLRAYKNLFGDLLVPTAFSFSSLSKETALVLGSQANNLGRHVHRIRSIQKA